MDWGELSTRLIAGAALGLSLFNTWQAHRRKPPIFEQKIRRHEGYWSVTFATRNFGSSTLELTRATSSNIAFATYKDTPYSTNSAFVTLKDPKAATYSKEGRIGIDVPPDPATPKEFRVYFADNPSRRQMRLYWRWSHESKPRSSRIRINRYISDSSHTMTIINRIKSMVGLQ